MTAPGVVRDRRNYAPGIVTQELILDVAERLFAERGIDKVSLKEIALQAGQANTAAVNYHFESKEGLIRALFQRRAEQLNVRRREILGDRVSLGAALIARGLVQPFVEQAQAGLRYPEFIRRLIYEYDSAMLFSLVEGPSDAMWRRLSEAMVAGGLAGTVKEGRQKLALAAAAALSCLSERQFWTWSRPGRTADGPLPAAVIGRIAVKVAAMILRSPARDS